MKGGGNENRDLHDEELSELFEHFVTLVAEFVGTLPSHLV
jgi:hypothetical protein